MRKRTRRALQVQESWLSPLTVKMRRKKRRHRTSLVRGSSYVCTSKISQVKVRTGEDKWFPVYVIFHGLCLLTSNVTSYNYLTRLKWSKTKYSLSCNIVHLFLSPRRLSNVLFAIIIIHRCTPIISHRGDRMDFWLFNQTEHMSLIYAKGKLCGHFNEFILHLKCLIFAADTVSKSQY